MSLRNLLSAGKSRKIASSNEGDQSQPEVQQQQQSQSGLTPRVLTRSVIGGLTQGLDASDVLECYALVRSAPLHGIANSTLKVNKMALGLRYRPTAASALSGAPQRLKRPLELTLEYGPQRIGPSLHHEAMPYINIDDADETSAFIAWENVGQVYYTSTISSNEYLSAYYMASMTGAVLNAILTEAVEYSEKRRRYQPFAVYSVANGKELRSSSSTDFMHYMWQHLAVLGVEVEPILEPPIYEARLWVDGIDKVLPEPPVTRAAAIFYRKLYQCLEAIATGDYSAYVPDPTDSPTGTLPPSPSPSHAFTEVPTEVPTNSLTKTQPSTKIHSPPNDTKSFNNTDDQSDDTDVIEDEDLIDGRSSEDGGLSQEPTEVPEEKDNDDELDDDQFGLDGDDDEIPSDDNESTLVNDASNDDDYSHDDDDASNDDEGNDRTRRRLDQYEGNDGDDDDYDGSGQGSSSFSDVPSPSPSATYLPTDVDINGSSGSGNNDKSTTGVDVEAAKQAAQEAQVAADEAKEAAQTEGETKAADAAQAAANAAQKAADATSNAAAQAAMDGLLSGDGTMMSSIVSTCFSNPQYDIASLDENGTVIAPVSGYLYKDGSMYYKLNLTSPYFEIVKVDQPLPRVNSFDEYGSGGDFVDWMLALAVLGMVALGIIVILQQAGYHFFEPLYKCQHWFFNPRRQNGEYQRLNVEDQATLEHGVTLFSFGEDAIPLSMGGRRTTVSPIQNRQNHETSPIDDFLVQHLGFPTLSDNAQQNAHASSSPDSSRHLHNSNGTIRGDDGDNLGHVELKRMTSRGRRVRMESPSPGSNSSYEDDTDDDDLPERFKRDPDLVDLPDLKSKSKVAVPVGVNGGSGSGSFSSMD